ncbi:hypothetical protein EV421DRAFT_1461662 [Armillaria borealis]|uniref:Uncharacterized protein n=1 Tax=Armillaria borealis TaxID=47425 RepID=A0AA39IZP5_9AGAR|nr:hypothetical protein EV421DRAFT_1461662 [Armillaria borealis]
MPHLASGSGPWLGGIPGVPQTATGPIVGQLDPWPGVGSPAIQNCPVINPLVPVASAGFDATVVSGANVTLFGGVKNDIDVTNLTFSWLQTSGVTVELANANSINATFLAPAVSTVSTLVFTLTVSNDAGESSDQVVININPGPTVDSITVEEASWKSGKGSGTLTVIASTNVISSQLFVSATDPDVDTIAMTSLGSGRFQALVSIRPSPVLVTITSSLGASVTVSVSD